MGQRKTRVWKEEEEEVKEENKKAEGSNGESIHCNRPRNVNENFSDIILPDAGDKSRLPINSESHIIRSYGIWIISTLHDHLRSQMYRNLTFIPLSIRGVPVNAYSHLNNSTSGVAKSLSQIVYSSSFIYICLFSKHRYLRD